MAEIDDRVLQFKTLRLPGQPMTMHIGTSNLVGDMLDAIIALDRQRLDLLDALRRIMTYAHDGAAVRDIDTTEQPEFVAARAAIAKAEGR